MVSQVSRSLKLALPLALVLALVLSGCGQPTSSPTSTPTTPGTTTTPPTSTPTTTKPTAPTGEVKVALATFGEEKFDPVIVTQTDVTTVIAPMSEYMFRTNGRDLAPGLVEKWELSPDGGSWIFHIRKGIKFHNGEDLKADDVKLALERYESSESFYAYVRDVITGVVDVIDEYTVRVYTTGPQPFLPWLLSSGVGNQGFVVPKDYYGTVGAAGFQKNPVGNGPFKFARHIPGDTIEYEAVANHWRQTPAFKKLSLIMIPEQTTRMALLKTGGVDLIDVDIETAADARDAGYKVSEMSFSADAVVFHGVYEPEAASMPAANIKVRKALSLAIDREEIRQTVMAGLSGPPTPPMLTYNAADIDVDAMKTYLAEINKYDPDEAKKLLTEAGYPNGFDIKIFSYAMGGSPYLPDMALIIQGYWNKIGVRAQIVPVDWGIFKTMRTVGPNKVPDAQVLGHASVMAASETPVAPLKLSTGYQSLGTWNLFGRTKPELDKLIAQSFSELDDAKRKAIIEQTIKQIVESYVSPSIGSSPVLAAMGKNVDVDFPPLTLSIPMHADIIKHKK